MGKDTWGGRLKAEARVRVPGEAEGTSQEAGGGVASALATGGVGGDEGEASRKRKGTFLMASLFLCKVEDGVIC